MICEQTIPSGSWISTKDKLPPFPEGKDYSETVIGWDGRSLGIYRRYYINGEGWLWARASYVCFGCLSKIECEVDDDYNVTHWMPLPQPPEIAGIQP